MMTSKRIGFFHLDEIHHINHFISVAVALSKTNEVSILTYPGKHTYLYQSLTKFQDHQVKVIQLPTHWFRALTDKLKKKDLPRKGFWMKKNKKFLLNHFDAVVFTDYFHHKLLKARGNRATPKFIKFPHGAPGRDYSYNRDQLDFDFQLLFGSFHYQQFKEKKLLGPHPVVIGYPKMDAVKNNAGQTFFANDKPVILYNPHFSPPFSSWHEMGLDVLEFFYNQKNYNLIFAPHINLFKDKGGVDPNTIPEKYFKSENIYMDLGSSESVDMTYLKAASIFLGEVSSQVYEFILEPRPCIFINTQKVSYQNDTNFRFWKLGDVIQEVNALDNAIKVAYQNFEMYRPVQEKIAAENFYQEENTTATERAAQALNDFLAE
jgi:glycosyltransferase involved in cell wall biosynthesis